MLFPQLEEKLQASKHSLNTSTSENIIQHCKHYLELLDEYRTQLYELHDGPGVRRQSTPPVSGEVPDREAIRFAIETTTQERNRTQVLLLSFTTVSGYEAVEIFNQRSYEGHDDWELRSSGVRFQGGDNNDLMTIQEAVSLASLLRREDYVTQAPPWLSGQIISHPT
jgi:hypothetical protein